MQKNLVYLLVAFLIVAGLGFALGYSVNQSPVAQTVGITTKSDLQAADITATGDITATDDLSVGDDLTVTDEVSYGGVANDWIVGSLADATTTPLSIVNPFGADVILDKIYLNITNGTSTIALTCGTSTTAGSLSADPTDLLIDDLSIASSTAGTATTTAKVINGDDYAGTGLASAGANSEDAILWRSTEYLKCYADTLYSGALTEVTNMFSGTYKIHTFR